MTDRILSYQLVLKSIRHSKRKSILSVLTVMISVGLLVVVFSYFYSSNITNKIEAKKNTEAYHAEYANLSKWQIKQIMKNKEIKNKFLLLTAKDMHVMNDAVRESQINTKVLYMENADKNCKFCMGREPKEKYDIVLDEWVMEVMKLPLKLNQTVKLSMLYEDERGQKKTKTEDFSLVGIRKGTSEQRLQYSSYVLVSKEYIDENSGKVEQGMRVKLRSNYNCIAKLKKIGIGIGIQEKQIDVNVAYTDAYDVRLESILKYVMVLIVVLFIAAMVIYNIFSIYMIQKIRLYGTLKAVGFTKRQQASFVLLEGIFLAASGSLLGILFGAGLRNLFVYILERKDKFADVKAVMLPIPILLTLFFTGILIVLIGIYRPMKKVLKMSEIDAMRFYSMEKDRNKLRKSYCDDKISILSMVWKNIERNKKRTIYHMGAIVLTGGLFLVVSTLLNSMNVENLIKNSVHGDLSVQLTDSISRDKMAEAVLVPGLIKEMEEIKGVTSLHTVMYERLHWNTEDAKKYLNLTEEHMKLGLDYGDMDSVFYGYEDFSINEVLKQLGDSSISLEKMKNENIAIAVEDRESKLKVHDKVRMKDSENGHEVEVEIAGIVKNNITYRGYKASANDLIVHQNLFRRLKFDTRIQRAFINVNHDKISQVRSYLNSHIIKGSDKLVLVSYSDLNKEYREQKNAISIGMYSFVILLFLIAVFNLINSTFANILSRKREIGIMQALGLTCRQLSMMLHLENLLIVIGSGIISTLLGIPAGYGCFLLFRTQASYAKYKIAFSPIAILLISFIVVQMAVTWLAKREIEKETTIERIRYIEV